jgi:hypothetical protein
VLKEILVLREQKVRQVLKVSWVLKGRDLPGRRVHRDSKVMLVLKAT